MKKGKKDEFDDVWSDDESEKPALAADELTPDESFNDDDELVEQPRFYDWDIKKSSQTFYHLKEINHRNPKQNYKTMLIEAAERPNLMVVEELLELKADINVADADGYTALSWVYPKLCQYYAYHTDESLSIAEKLIAAGADVWTPTPQSPIFKESRQPFLKSVIEYLIEPEDNVKKQLRTYFNQKELDDFIAQGFDKAEFHLHQPDREEKVNYSIEQSIQTRKLIKHSLISLIVSGLKAAKAKDIREQLTYTQRQALSEFKEIDNELQMRVVEIEIDTYINLLTSAISYLPLVSVILSYLSNRISLKDLLKPHIETPSPLVSASASTQPEKSSLATSKATLYSGPKKASSPTPPQAGKSCSSLIP